MTYYLMNAVPDRVREQRARADFMTILALEKGTLPVFTSLESFWDFGTVFYPETHELSSVPFRIGASDLVDMVEEMVKMTPLRFMVFDPVAISAERCNYATEPVSVMVYCRSVKASRPDSDR